ncbi:UDP-N-acetylglucosamine 2-epimerase (non-hydrolyzing) (plasmid) [Rhizobium sullae]|uniref:UDP-N-acetylglucosamine 2-epimerase (non-hydrolyzing) n=1 Tax=Rhizobium sullae TaxID=50338 RepID=A0A2N0D9R5_RHISU|nr:UDP-N-acetylglucosamine 2-epimerase (non-hydrolyzing) [Rhizobium sullae]PKA42824.1 UDP-N-acetylglucosamine 2-epimerase (non-hydrolyzing) [Rhizobium sullae]UWU18225.1 UDP-N-acetylglucosamine 2-epimerase (non-hydrolyzing) [Rhizobium sullae]
MSSSGATILAVLGTRPEAIKLAPLVKAAAADPSFDIRVCVTGQHRFMLDQVLDVFGIKPDYDLNLMKPAQSLAEVTSRIVVEVANVIREARPEWVIVQGDTTTAFASSLAAFYEKVSIAHVEAGLRTSDKYSPYPEEANRRFISTIADLHFAPTSWASGNLLQEGHPENSVFVTGNSVIDALVWVINLIKSNSVLREQLDDRFSFLKPYRRLVLVTGHRRESFGNPIRRTCEALVDLVGELSDVEILYPVHLNPNVQEPVNAILGCAHPELRERIHLIAPVDYVSFVYLMARAHLIITDSGGIQEEAPSLGVPVLITRQHTERPEGIEAGVAKLIGTDRTRIVEEAIGALSTSRLPTMTIHKSPYGDGLASARMIEKLRERVAGTTKAQAIIC